MVLEGEIGHEYFTVLRGGADVVVEQLTQSLVGHREYQVRAPLISDYYHIWTYVL